MKEVSAASAAVVHSASLLEDYSVIIYIKTLESFVSNLLEPLVKLFVLRVWRQRLLLQRKTNESEHKI